MPNLDPYGGYPGQIWSGDVFGWVWPLPDNKPTFGTAGGPPPVPNRDIATNAAQAQAYVATALEQCDEMTGLGIIGGPGLTVDWLIEYAQKHGKALQDLVQAIGTCLATIQGLAK